MKKCLILVLALLMLMTGVPALADDADWNFDSEYYYLRGYNGAGGDVVVPGNIGTGTVDVIESNVFNGSQTITSLTLPDTLLEMRSGVGSWCPNLVSVTLPESLIVIGNQCFMSCDALTEVTIPAGVRYIGKNSFYACHSLSRVIFEGVCPILNAGCFDMIAENAEIFVPDDQLEAYQAAFDELEITASISASGRNAVIVDNNQFDENHFEMDAASGTITAYYGFATYLAIPESIGGVPVRAIGESAFAHHNYLALLELPEGLETIGKNAFVYCQTLQYVAFPESLRVIDDGAFEGGYKGSRLEIAHVETIGDNAFRNSFVNGVLVLPEGLSSIGEKAFATSIFISEISMPSTLERIGDSAFENNWGLSYVCMDSLVPPKMGENVFAGCTMLEDIDLNEHCTKVQMLDVQAYIDAMGLSCRVWRNQNSLTSYTYDDDPSNYSGSLMTGYTGSLTHIRPWDDITGIADGALKGNTTVEYFAVCHSDEFTTIGAEAFMDSALRGVDLFDSVTTIGDRAFSGCLYLEELTIPESVTFIGTDAFANLPSLKKVTILCDASMLPAGAFAGCPALTEAVIAQGVIPERLFEGAALTSLTLGDGVTGIGNSAFTSTKLTDVNLNQVKEIGAHAFEYAPLTAITLADGACIGDYAFASTGLSTVDLSQVQQIGAHAFEYAPLTAITLADGASIGDYAFASTGLSTVDLSQVQQIGAHAFEYAPLTAVTLADGAGIGDYAFASTGLSTVDLSQVQQIGAHAFEYAPLTAITLADGAGIGDYAFASTLLTGVDLSAVNSVGESAFEASLLESVTLGDTVTVGEKAFANTALKTFVFPASDSFPLSALEGTAPELWISANATDAQCAALNEKLGYPWYDPILRQGEEHLYQVMPFEPTSAESFEFDAETGLITAYIGTDVDVVVPREIDGVTVVGFANYNVFESCRDYTDSSMETNVTEWVHLRTLVLPETIRELPDSMLSYCQQLETFICYAPLERTGATQFMLCRSLNTVIYVNGVREISSYAFDSAGPLNNLYFGKHLDRICEQAFNYAELTSLVVDASVLEGGAFTCCHNLTSLHFTGKVQDIAQGCVNDCQMLNEVCFDISDMTNMSTSLFFQVAPQLTVRVPEGMSAESLEIVKKCVGWSAMPSEVQVTADSCEHVMPERPDIAALLAEIEENRQNQELAAPAVPQTTQAPAANICTSVPEEYVGIWYGESMIMEGETLLLSDIGMVYTITILEDGTAYLELDGEQESTMCMIEEGVLSIDGAIITLENDKLICDEDGVFITLGREEPETTVVEAAPEDENATQDSFLGTWQAVRITTEGLTFPAEMAGIAEDTLVIHGDTCDLSMFGILFEDLPCRMDGHRLVFNVMDGEGIVTLHTDGTIAFEMDDSLIWYERIGDAMANVPETPVQEPEASPTEPPVQAGGEEMPSIAMETKYVMTDMDMGAFEYALVFHENGTADFTMAGTAIPGLKWHEEMIQTEEGEKNGAVIDYFGQNMSIVLTETGFEMDFMGVMLMHFAPVEP